MDQAKLNNILKNVLQNVYKLKDVSNIISQYSIYIFMETLVIFNLTKNTEFITYEYTSDSLIYLNSIHKIYKTIKFVNNPKEIYTNKFIYRYYNSIKYISSNYSDNIIDNFNCLFYCKYLTHNITKYIYRTNYAIYACINKYKINNLIYKKNVKNYIHKVSLNSLNKVFIHYNFARSYNIFYLL